MLRILREMTIPLAPFEIGFIDDPFLRISVNLYVCGCWHNCEGCQNPDLQDPNSPLCERVTLEYICKRLAKYRRLAESVCYLGGDFGYYLDAYYYLSQYAKSLGYNNVLYTGFKLEQLDQSKLVYTDIVIDGPYIQKLHQDSFPASSNQRVFIRNGDKFEVVDPSTLPINKRKSR